ncbi:hypothetical protein EFK50_05020 [Nocardioides marmoriginsengisoli]|uniref:Uncharacterized protein n=1 Tax=Nocardioides marmoriginsengisoli TaxID=661483 RepID=A0A3N0CQZ0_9ACTN|nr:hypothetical protein [Nocardioides marmoriginsengisoli]RNL65323.1 hypothetical protein EFK50_05020 [Nocardioides marmoriginsengisoli]
MTTIQAQQAPAHTMPRASSRDGVAPLRGNPAQLLHLVLFVAGAVLLPTGLIVIGLGWYGAAHTLYQYDQIPYLISGGVLGLGITFVGGFLYFGSWLARIAADQKDAQRQLSETLLLLADAVAQNSAQNGAAPVETAVAAPYAAPAETVAAPAARPAATPARARDAGSVLVTAGRGKTMHRADCDLIAGREDLQPVGANADGLVPCRLCQS